MGGIFCYPACGGSAGNTEATMEMHALCCAIRGEISQAEEDMPTYILGDFNEKPSEEGVIKEFAEEGGPDVGEIAE